jgi:hypothetical protein
MAEPAPASEVHPLSISVEGQEETLPNIRAPVIGPEVQVVLYTYIRPKVMSTFIIH